MPNFQDKTKYETIKQYLDKKANKKEQKMRENVAFIGILIMLFAFFVSFFI